MVNVLTDRSIYNFYFWLLLQSQIFAILMESFIIIGLHLSRNCASLSLSLSLTFILPSWRFGQKKKRRKFSRARRYQCKNSAPAKVNALVTKGNVGIGNTHLLHRRKYHCTADLLHYWFEINQTSKYADKIIKLLNTARMPVLKLMNRGRPAFKYGLNDNSFRTSWQ